MVWRSSPGYAERQKIEERKEQQEQTDQSARNPNLASGYVGSGVGHLGCTRRTVISNLSAYDRFVPRGLRLDIACRLTFAVGALSKANRWPGLAQ